MATLELESRIFMLEGFPQVIPGDLTPEEFIMKRELEQIYKKE